MKKKFLAAVLACALALSMLSFGALAAAYPDTEGHWGESSIERWSGYGIVQGMDGTFNPDASMTRAQFATVLANLLGLKTQASNSFADVEKGAWYESAILKCVAAGILKGDGEGANPDVVLSREEAIVMLGRALKIQPAEGEIAFADGGQVADWAAGYVKALTEKNIIGGVGDNQIAPKLSINRASVTKILDNAITTYSNQAGETVEAKGDGITLVAAPGVTVTGQVADMLVAPGAEQGRVVLKDAQVSGTVTLAASQTELALTGTTKTSAIVVEETAGKSTVNVASTASAESIAVAAPQAKVEVSGTVNSVETSATATDTAIVANSGAQIKAVDSKADGVSISGSGKVDAATVSGDNTKVDTSGTKLTVEENTSGVTNNGSKVESGTETTTKPGTSGGIGGGGGGDEGPSAASLRAALLKHVNTKIPEINEKMAYANLAAAAAEGSDYAVAVEVYEPTTKLSTVVNDVLAEVISIAKNYNSGEIKRIKIADSAEITLADADCDNQIIAAVKAWGSGWTGDTTLADVVGKASLPITLYGSRSGTSYSVLYTLCFADLSQATVNARATASFSNIFDKLTEVATYTFDAQTLTVTIVDGTKTVGDVYAAISGTLSPELTNYADFAAIKVGASQELTYEQVSGDLRTLVEAVKASGLLEGITGQTALSELNGKNVTVTLTSRAGRTYEYTVSFSD